MPDCSCNCKSISLLEGEGLVAVYAFFSHFNETVAFSPGYIEPRCNRIYQYNGTEQDTECASCGRLVLWFAVWEQKLEVWAVKIKLPKETKAFISFALSIPINLRLLSSSSLGKFHLDEGVSNSKI